MITFNKAKRAANHEANNFRRGTYAIFCVNTTRPKSMGPASDVIGPDMDIEMFYLGVVFWSGDKKSQLLAIRDINKRRKRKGITDEFVGPPLGNMDFAKGVDWAAETYNKIRNGERIFAGFA